MKKILIAAPVHCGEKWRTEAFEFCLDSLAKQEIPSGYEIDKLFMLHNSSHLIPLMEKYKCFYNLVESQAKYKTDDRTHYWENANIQAVTKMRSNILEYARKTGYDFLLLVDSDLVLNKYTLETLISQKKDIVAEIIWTKWTPEDIEAPSAWDSDVYAFYPDIHTRIAEFRKPGCYRVGMTGACTLISKPVLSSGINYDKLHNVSFWGEDRHFCIKAAAHGFEIWIDTHYPCLHLYRQSDVEKIKNEVK